VADRFSDECLASVLASVGEELVLPDVDQLWAPPRLRRLRVAAAAVVVVTTGGVAIAPVREAVADWFGFGSTAFERVEPEAGDPTGLPPLDAGLPTVSASQAAALLGRLLPTVAALGEPDRIGLPPEGGVLLAWDESSTTLWALPTVDPPAVRLRKLLDDHDVVEPVEDLGEGAVSVHGDHVLTTPNRRVAASSVVLWIDAGYEYRLEGDLPLDELIGIARSID
jgi:hypothetical protein